MFATVRPSSYLTRESSGWIADIPRSGHIEGGPVHVTPRSISIFVPPRTISPERRRERIGASDLSNTCINRVRLSRLTHRRLINYVSREKDEYWIRILIRSDPATRQLEERTRKEKEKKVSSKQGHSSLLLPFHRREYYIIDRTHVLMLPCPPAWSTRNLDTRPDAARGTSLSLSPQIYFSIIVGISKTLGE